MPKKKTKEEFIVDAKKVHGDKYNYVDVDYVNNTTKVKIICPIHGEFIQTPKDHLNGCGCRLCSSCPISKHTTSSFVEKAKVKHGDKYDYSKVIYVNNKERVIITCPTHGDFEQRVDAHLKGAGCLRCSGNFIKTDDEVIQRFRVVHGDKYDYSKVGYVNNTTKVKIICPKHGEFLQTPKGHLSGKGCFKCGRDRIALSGLLSVDDFWERSNELYGDKFEIINLEYKTQEDNIDIKCTSCGKTFKRRIRNHLKGMDCPYCVGKVRLNRELFIEKAIKKHGDRYDYSNVGEISSNKDIVEIRCKEHGIFFKRVSDHLSRGGCQKCSKEEVREKRKTSFEEFLEKANKVHGNKFTYIEESYNTVTSPVRIVCPIHGEFEQKAITHLIGFGCAKCSKKVSKPEIELCDFICNELGIEIETRNRSIISPYELDIYIPSKKIAIEFNGIIWHSEKFGKDKNYHLMKTNMCEELGIKLIHIYEHDWLDDKDFIKNNIMRIIVGYDDGELVEDVGEIVKKYYTPSDLYKIKEIYGHDTLRLDRSVYSALECDNIIDIEEPYVIFSKDGYGRIYNSGNLVI